MTYLYLLRLPNNGSALRRGLSSQVHENDHVCCTDTKCSYLRWCFRVINQVPDSSLQKTVLNHFMLLINIFPPYFFTSYIILAKFRIQPLLPPAKKKKKHICARKQASKMWGDKCAVEYFIWL